MILEQAKRNLGGVLQGSHAMTTYIIGCRKDTPTGFLHPRLLVTHVVIGVDLLLKDGPGLDLKRRQE